MLTLHEIPALRAQLDHWCRCGERVALVPTMGNLHAGHLQLVERARQLADRVAVSVFVNPLQFGPSEDFARYPRTLDADREALTAVGADLLFAPEDAAIYPHGRESATRVVVPDVTAQLEGAFRPGHFDGVATVVAILFHLFRPQVAVFGEKDYQQLQVIRRLVADLHLGVDVIGLPTVRDTDGLALSSRNQYLTPAERGLAPALYATLSDIGARLRGGERDYEALSRHGCEQLRAQGFDPQYLEVRRPDLSLPDEADTRWVVLVAAYLGRTRLIDNLKVEQPDAPIWASAGPSSDAPI